MSNLWVCNGCGPKFECVGLLKGLHVPPRYCPLGLPGNWHALGSVVSEENEMNQLVVCEECPNFCTIITTSNGSGTCSFRWCLFIGHVRCKWRIE